MLTELRALRSKFHPTYETRADYDILVAKYVNAVTNRPILHERGDLSWADDVPPDFNPSFREAKAKP